MKKFNDIEISWISENEPDWIKEVGINQIGNVVTKDSTGLNLNVSIIRKKISFDKLIDKFLALMGVSIATTTQWERIILGVLLAYVICPIHIKFFKNNDTKKVFELIESDFGDNYIDKVKLLETNDESLINIVNKLKRENMIEEEEGRYYFNEIVLKSFNIGK